MTTKEAIARAKHNLGKDPDMSDLAEQESLLRMVAEAASEIIRDVRPKVVRHTVTVTNAQVIPLPAGLRIMQRVYKNGVDITDWRVSPEQQRSIEE